ncbi:hypothetical protein AGMMS50218_08870 [Actinomycetota bacterium]|nr:hypothetical protein AGMMS50218_08870 [Actinomycetota bacterium]
MFSSRRSWARAALASVAGAAMLALGAGASSAAPSALIDPNATGSLTVHKFEQPDGRGPAGNGLPQATTGLTPLAGVEFTVAPVTGIDLSTNAGWTDAAALTVADAQGRLGAPRSLATDADGIAAFTGLPVGLYLVTETGVPSGVTPSAPFLVTLPITHPTSTDTWLYDVHVYPKNAVTGGEKTVADAGAIKLGDEIVFTILGDIPKVDVIDGYKIVDPLDAKLDYVSTAVRLLDGSATLVAGTDYVLTTTPTAPTTVTVEFTAAGRAKLAEHTDTRIEVVITTTVNTIGEILNEALIYPNEGSFSVQPGEPGGPVVPPGVTTKWGNIVLQKTDSVNGSFLAGAQFQVFATQADAQALTNPITIDSVNTWTTDADGKLVISGLHYSNYADGTVLNPGDAKWQSYWLVEVKAPVGYELLAAPVKVDVTSDSTTAITVDVKNVKANAGFQLPFTGSAGTGAITATGAALVLLGLGALAVRNRRARITTA